MSLHNKYMHMHMCTCVVVVAYPEGDVLAKVDVARDGEMVQLKHIRNVLKPLQELLRHKTHTYTYM